MNDSSRPAPIDESTVIGGTYRIEEGVARGGFSTIYRASHVEMDRAVALKVLTIDENVGAGALERFSQEARLACQINHPNVVTIYDFGQDERGLLYIAMEWMEGRPLRRLVQEEGAIEPRRVARLGRGLARGLAAVHHQGIFHRDLKASNVMITRPTASGELAKLLDFGVAKAADIPEEEKVRITQKGRFVGTPRYAAPEQIQGEELTEQTDLYGLGLLLWEAVVGEPAVPEVNFQECCSYHLSEEAWQLPDEVSCPKPLAEIIHRALRKEPAERFDSAEEMAGQLDDVLHTMEAATAVSATSTASSQWTKFLFGLLIAGSVGLLYGYPGLLSLTSPDEPTAMRKMDIEFHPTDPASLLDAAEAAGWTVQDRDKGDAEGVESRATLTKDGESIQLAILPPSAAHGAEDPLVDLIHFSEFTVRIRADESAGPHFHRLTGELRLLHAEHTPR
jgi:serine/threonine protein kinase